MVRRLKKTKYKPIVSAMTEMVAMAGEGSALLNNGWVALCSLSRLKKAHEHFFHGYFGPHV